MKPVPFRRIKCPLSSAVFVPLALVALILAVPARAQERELFKITPTAFADMPPQQQGVLTKLREAKGLEVLKVVQIDGALLGGENVTLDLAPGLKLKSTKGKVERTDATNFIWSTGLTGKESHALFVVHGKNVTATISTEKGVYQVRPLGDGMHAIVKIDYAKMPDEHPPSFKEIEKKTPPPPAPRDVLSDTGAKADAVATFRVLVAYTPAVNAAVADIQGLIDIAIQETNQGFANSLVNAKAVLAHTHQVNYVESGSFDTDLANFRNNGDGSMDEIHDLRKKYCADVLVLLINDTAYCGLASAIMADAGTAFVVVYHNCATGYYSFAHEIGHLAGCRHNPQADPTTTPFSYGHGYQHGPEFRTIMAYADGCTPPCPRINYWSNPSVSYNGIPTGTAVTNDNHRVWNTTASTVAGFVSDIACLRIDWGKFKYLVALCKYVGCGILLHGEQYINPAPEFLKAVEKGGPTAKKLQGAKEKAIGLVLQAERATPATEKSIESQARTLDKEVRTLVGTTKAPAPM